MIKLTDRRFVKAIKRVTINIVGDWVTVVHRKSGKTYSGILTNDCIMVCPAHDCVFFMDKDEYEVLY